MRKFVLFLIAGAGFISCAQSRNSETVERETANSTRKYSYADPMGKRLVIQNSVPKGGGYMDANGQRVPYVVFYTQITNETTDPVELKIDLPLLPFEFPLSSGNHMEIFVPSDTMTLDKVSLVDYGLSIKSSLEKGRVPSHSLHRSIMPNGSTAFYIVLRSDKGVGGALRAGLSLKGQSLLYKIAAYKSIPGLPLMEEKEFNCGTINLENLVLQE